MKRIFLLFFLEFCLLFFFKGVQATNSHSSSSQEGKREGASIAIVVNADAITHQDIRDRALLVLLTAGLQNDPKLLKTIKEQVKKSLIDEKIQLQAAKQQKISVSPQEVEEALKNISADNNMSLDDMKAMFKEKSISIKTLEDRLRAQIAWARTVNDAFGGMIPITEIDVQNALKKIKENKEKDQYELSEILLRVDHPAQEQSVKRDIEKIYQQLKEGAYFRVMAQQFSQGPASARGGHVGWMATGQMDPAIEPIVTKMEVGAFSQPIRTSTGYKLILLQDIKKAGGASYGQTEIVYAQVLIPFQDSLSEEDSRRLDDRLKVLTKAKSCQQLEKSAKDFGYRCEKSPKTRFGLLPDPLKELFRTARTGECLTPVRTQDHLVVTMLCYRQTPDEKMPSPLQIKKMLEQEKIGKAALREFNKLRSISFIDDKTIVP